MKFKLGKKINALELLGEISGKANGYEIILTLDEEGNLIIETPPDKKAMDVAQMRRDFQEGMDKWRDAFPELRDSGFSFLFGSITPEELASHKRYATFIINTGKYMTEETVSYLWSLTDDKSAESNRKKRRSKLESLLDLLPR